MDQHRAWETIAESFDRSRTRTWPHVDRFLAGLSPGRVLDLMTGNGRHVPSIQHGGHDAVVLDWARPLVKIAATRHDVDGVAGDATRLPFADSTFDACVYVAGLHGIPTAEGRAQSLAELRRVLRPGGKAQITVWSRDAPRFRDEGTPGEPVDVVIPWRSDGHDVARAYHLYTASTLRRDVEAAGLHVTGEAEASVVSEADNLVIEAQR